MELFIITLVVGVSLFFVIRNLIKVFKGEASCNCSCNSCGLKPTQTTDCSINQEGTSIYPLHNSEK